MKINDPARLNCFHTPKTPFVFPVHTDWKPKLFCPLLTVRLSPSAPGLGEQLRADSRCTARRLLLRAGLMSCLSRAASPGTAAEQREQPALLSLQPLCLQEPAGMELGAPAAQGAQPSSGWVPRKGRLGWLRCLSSSPTRGSAGTPTSNLLLAPSLCSPRVPPPPQPQGKSHICFWVFSVIK